MPIVTDSEGIRDILTRYRRIAVVGLSNNPDRPSNDVSRFMQEQGYEIYPVNPMIAGQELLGRTVYASLADLPVRPEIVNVFRRSEYVAAIAEQAIAAGADVLWTQLFVVDDLAAQRASDAGLKVVQNRCLKIEYHKQGLASQDATGRRRRLEQGNDADFRRGCCCCMVGYPQRKAVFQITRAPRGGALAVITRLKGLRPRNPPSRVCTDLCPPDARLMNFHFLPPKPYGASRGRQAVAFTLQAE